MSNSGLSCNHIRSRRTPIHYRQHWATIVARQSRRCLSWTNLYSRALQSLKQALAVAAGLTASASNKVHARALQSCLGFNHAYLAWIPNEMSAGAMKSKSVGQATSSVCFTLYRRKKFSDYKSYKYCAMFLLSSPVVHEFRRAFSVQVSFGDAAFACLHIVSQTRTIFIE